MQAGLEAAWPAVTQIRVSALLHQRTYAVEYGPAQGGPGAHRSLSAESKKSAREDLRGGSASEFPFRGRGAAGGETHSTVLGAMVSTRLPVRGEYGINVQAERDVLIHSLRHGFRLPGPGHHFPRCADPEEGHAAFGKISNGDHAMFRSSRDRLLFMLSVRGPESQRLSARSKEPPAPSSPVQSLRLSNGIERADAK